MVFQVRSLPRTANEVSYSYYVADGIDFELRAC